MVVKELFGKVKIYRLLTRVDNRGSLAYVFDESIDDFKARERRYYMKIWGISVLENYLIFYKKGINCYLMMKRRG